MKKIILFIALFLIFFSFSFTSFSQTLHYNGGSGPQIVVTENNDMLTVTLIPNAYNTPLEGDWYVPGNVYRQMIYPGVPFEKYGSAYEFMISGSVTVESSNVAAWYPFNWGYQTYQSESTYVWY